MLILCLLICLTIFSSSVSWVNGTECKPDAATCEYWLVVENLLTMRYNNYPVYGHEGKLYKYDEDWRNSTTYINISKVITLDGVPRMVTAVNKTIPGPPIIVYENQELIIHMHNKLLSESMSIHWHGLEQRGTPWMDGVPYITMCPITAGQKFTVKFRAYPKGTYWYHSHMGSQRTNGLFGAIVIKEKPTPNVTPPKDIIMTVGDWQHDQSTEVFIKDMSGNYINKEVYRGTFSLDGGFLGFQPWISALIDGKGRYIDPKSGKQTQVPLKQFDVVKGEKCRFRVIGVGVIYPLRISVDNHNLTLAASDGFDLKERIVESIIINPGERYDFFLEANQPVGNYWIRAVSLQVKVKNHSVEAILHYDGAANGTEPTTSRKQCTVQDPCYVVNCPFLYYPKGSNTFCLTFDDLEAKVDDAAPTYNSVSSEQHFLNFGFPRGRASINGRQFVFDQNFPAVKGDHDCNSGKHTCGVNKTCSCNYNLKLKYNETIQMIWSAMGIASHPIHLHGHTFYVLKVGFPVFNQTTAKRISKNPDIDCGGNYCNEASWSNKITWTNGNIPGMNLKNPPRKDTIIIPAGGYVVLRIRSDNPGIWFMHCHVEIHQLEGMAMFIDEASDKQTKLPKGFPTCKNFYDDLETKCERQRQSASYKLGAFVPQCESDGSYTKKQCSGSTGYCWCVDKNGTMINGTNTPPPASRSLSCSNETKCEKQRQVALNEILRNKHMVGFFVPQCDADGAYTKKQCRGSTGYCWCVDKNGTMINGTNTSPPASRCLSCSNETKCEKQRQVALNETLNKHMVGVFVPRCDADGAYSKKQCYGSTGYCWCVNKDGTMINGTETPPGIRGNLTCSNDTKCERQLEHALYLRTRNKGHIMVGGFLPRCDADGAYSKKQCSGSTGQCWCVDKEGRKINCSNRPEILKVSKDEETSSAKFVAPLVFAVIFGVVILVLVVIILVKRRKRQNERSPPAMSVTRVTYNKESGKTNTGMT